MRAAAFMVALFLLFCLIAPSTAWNQHCRCACCLKCSETYCPMEAQGICHRAETPEHHILSSACCGHSVDLLFDEEGIIPPQQSDHSELTRGLAVFGFPPKALPVLAIDIPPPRNGPF